MITTENLSTKERISIIPGLSQETIAAYAPTEEIYERGIEYHQEGAVREIIKSQHTIRAFVSGSQQQKYRISINFDDHGITSTNCSCPYDGTNCKHIIATLLECLNHPETVLQITSISESLNSLNESQLRLLIETMIDNNPGLYQKVMVDIDILKTTFQSNENKIPSDQNSLAVDCEPYKKALRSAFRNARGCYLEGGWCEQEVLDQLTPLITKVENFLAGNDGKNALRILEAITTTFIDELDNFDNIYDDDGEIAGQVDEILSQLSSLWCEAILTTNLTKNDEKRLSLLIEELQNQLDDCRFDFLNDHSYFFDPIIRSLKEGWRAATVQAALAGRQDSCADFLTHNEHVVAQARLNILQRQKRTDEYVNFARYVQFIPELVGALIQKKQIDEAFTTADKATLKTESIFITAKQFGDYGRPDYAVAIARKSLRAERQIMDLSEWLYNLAQSCDCHDVALEAAILSFKNHISLERYKRTLSLASSNEEKRVKDELIQFTLKNNSQFYVDIDDVIEVLLYEKLWDLAIAKIDSVDGDFYFLKLLQKKL